jgi:hypothetical protein
MDSLFQLFLTRRRLIVCSYLTLICIVIVAVIGNITGKWDLAGLPDQPSFMVELFAIPLVLHWCALYSTGPLSDTGFWHALGQRINIGNWLRILVMFRWLFAVPALALQFIVQCFCLTMCYMVLAGCIGLNVIMEDKLVDGFLGQLSLTGNIFFVICFFSLLFFTILACTIDRLHALLYSHAIITVISFYTLVVLAITLHLQLIQFQSRHTIIFALLLLPAVQFTLSLGALIRLCLWRANHSLNMPKPSSLPEPISSFSGTRNLSSARVFATALLLVNYVAIDVSIEYANDMGKLQVARSLVATKALRELKKSKKNSIDQPPLGKLSRVQKSIQKPIFSSFDFLEYVVQHEIIRTDTIDKRIWQSIPFQSKTEEPEKELIDRLRILAQQLDIKEVENDNLYQLFYRLEKQLLENKQVSLPVVGIPVVAGKAAWLLSVINLLILILIRSRIRRVFVDSQFAREEPWLILDGRIGLERYAAYLWLLMIGVSVWITHLGLLMTLGAQISVQGGIATKYGGLLHVVIAMLIFALEVWVSYDTYLHLITLRRLRREESAIKPDQVKSLECNMDNV